MKVIKRSSIICVLIISCFFLNGCWDYMEIERRGYVLGFSIDRADIIEEDDGEGNKYNKKLEEMMTMEGTPKYAYTLQLPIIARAQSRPSGQGGGGSGSQDRVWNITITGNSFFEAQRQYSTRTDYPPFYEHIQAIIISEDVAREGIIEPLDMLIRDPEMRRKIHIFVTEGEARKILDISPKIDDYSMMYINNLTENTHKTSRMFYRTDLGEISEALHTKSAFVVPRLLANSEEVKNAGGAVFKEGKMLGWVNEIDTSYIQWVADTIKGGVLVVPMPDHPEDLVTFEIYSASTKVRPIISGEEITFDIKTKAKFNLSEEFRSTFYDTFNTDFAKKAKREVKNKLEDEMARVIRLMQEEFEADIFGFSTAMERYAPDTWDKVKDNWDEVFSGVKFNISVDVKFLQRGLVK